MSSDGHGRAGSTPARALFDEAYRYEFFQAVRLLERLYPQRTPVGRHDIRPRGEVVRFRTRPSLQFPASEVHQVSADGDGEEGVPPEMMVSFMGVIGPLGVLPSATTELVAERARYKDTALWEFFDLFDHRLISLFYRAWERYRFAVAFERDGRDDFTEYLFNLVGMGTRGLRGRLGLPDEGLLLYSGLIAQRPHSATALESVVSDYFKLHARLEPFAGQWLELDEEGLCRLGGENAGLGVGTVLGTRVWDEQSKFRLVLGPLTLVQFRRLLPAGPEYAPLSNLVRFVAGPEFSFDVQLVLKAEEVPDCTLGPAAAAPPMLGWTTWLKTLPFSRDDSQVTLAAGQ